MEAIEVINEISQVVEIVEKGSPGQKGDQGEGADLQGSFFLQAGENIEIPLISSARFAFTIDALYNLVVESGEITLAVQINGVDVTGLSGLTVNDTPQNPTATAANEVEIGDRVTLVLTDNAAATKLEFTMKGQV